jgi:putative phage-type endonuclease
VTTAPPVVLECENETDWLHERRSRLTGSEIASIFDANKFKSRLELYAEKTGIIEPKPVDSEPVQWGKEFQGAIGRRFAQKTGREVTEANPFALYVHPDLDWLACTLDFFEKDKEKGEGILEAKATDFQWEEDAPPMYQIQLQCQLAITGIPYGTLCAFNGLKKPPVWIDYDRHDAFIKTLISKAEEFWWRVQTKNPPPVGVEASESTRAALSALYPHDTGTAVALPSEAVQWTEEIAKFEAQAKALEEQVKIRKNWLREKIADASYGALADGRAWKWAEVVTPMPAQEAYVKRYRMLKLVKGIK